MLVVSGVQAETLSLNQAVRMALASHPSLQQRRSSIEAAEFDMKAAEWKRYPSVSVEASNMVSKPAELSGVDSNAATVRVEQPLWTFGKLTAESDAAAGRRRVAELVLTETEQDLIGRVALNYVEALRLKERIGIAEKNLAEHQRLFDLINRRQDQGVSSAADVALAQARMQQAKTELSSMRASLDAVRLQLEQLIGTPVVGDLQAVAAPSALGWADRSSVLVDAKTYSPTLHRLEAEMDLAVVDVAARKAATMPNISARYERFDGSAQSVAYDRVMVVLAYQPGAGLSSLSAVDSAGSRANAARSAIEAGMRDVNDKASTLYTDAKLNLEQLAPAKAYVDAAAAVMESYMRQYTTGRKSWVDVMNAQRELTQASYALTDVSSGVLSSSIKLNVLTGRLNRASVFGTGAR